MVSLLSDEGFHSVLGTAPAPLEESAAAEFEVVIPVFLKVRVTAPDEFAAEVYAVEIARSLGDISVGDTKIRVHSIIAPQTIPPKMHS